MTFWVLKYRRSSLYEFDFPSGPVTVGAIFTTRNMFYRTEEYFLNHPGSEKAQVFAEGRKKEVRTEPGETMSFKKFVERYNHTDMYMVNSVPKHIR